MADINISKFTTQVLRVGSTPSSPGFAVDEGQDPVDPSGNPQTHLPVTIAAAADGLSITDAQVLSGAGTTAQYIRGDGSLASFPSLTGYVPYTGATADVDLGTHDLTAERGTFANNGSSDTLTVNHTSGSGYGIKVTKGGNNEALYVSKTSGSGNAMTVVGGRTALVDLSLSSVSNATGNFLTISGGVVHQRTAAEVRTDIGAGTGNGTVTSVSALTLGTSGTDLSSTVANGTTTPVITLNVPTASATNRGALSSADWSTFNNKQNALTNPVTGTGTTNYLPKFTSNGSTIGNSAFFDGGGFGGFNSAGLGSRTFVINAASGRPLALEVVEFANVHSMSLRPNNSGFNAISSNYLSGGTYLPLSLSARENNADFVLATNGNASFLSSVEAGGNYLINNLTASKKGYTFQSPASSWGPQVSGLYFTPNNAIDARTTFTLELWNGLGSIITPLTISDTGAATFSSSVTSNINGFVAINGYGLTSYPSSSSTGSNIIFSSSIFGGVDGIYQSSGNTSDFAIWTNGGTSTQAKLYIKNNGNVLIGTSTDAGFKLDVNGTGRFSGNLRIEKATPLLVLNDTSGAGAQIGSFGGNLNLIDNATGTKGVVINLSTGAATFSSSVSVGAGMSIGTTGTNNINWFTSGGIRLSRTNIGPEDTLTQRWTGSLAYIEIAASSQWNGGVTILPNGGGNVLIGTTTDVGFKLNVNGTGRFLNNLYVNSSTYPTNYSTSLRSDGSANGILQLGNNNINYILAGNTAAGGFLSIRVNVSAESISSGTEALRLNANATTTFSSLAGSGNRIVVANSAGTLISAVIGSGLAFDGTTLTATGGSSGSISGSGTSGTVALFTGTSSIGNSIITQSSGNIGIGTATPNRKLEVITGASTTNGIRLVHAAGTTTEGMDITYLNVGNTTTSFDSIYNSDSAVMQFRMKTAATPVTAMTILGSGNIIVAGKLNSTVSNNAVSFENTSITTGWNAVLRAVSTGGNFQLGLEGSTAGNRFANSIAYATFLATYTTTPIQFATDNAHRMTITSGGNVLINTTSDNGNRLRVNGTIFSDSSVTATSFFESSDATIKTLVQDNYQAKGIESVVAKLYIKNGKQELGYFAQDLQGILPSAVNKGTDGLLNLSYREVHTAKIASLENRIKELESQLKNN
jgi:hypothetical protein